MEIEFKYALPDSVSPEQVWQDPEVRRLTAGASPEKIRMDAVYYDTPDGRLRNARTALRLREENGTAVVTVKWDERGDGALFRRGEENVFLSSAERPRENGKALRTKSVLAHFTGTGAESFLRDLLPKDEWLLPLVETRFARERVVLRMEKFAAELAVDVGEIEAAGRTSAIRELEMELMEGSEVAFTAFGTGIARKFGLEPEKKSKFARGIELLT